MQRLRADISGSTLVSTAARVRSSTSVTVDCDESSVAPPVESDRLRPERAPQPQVVGGRGRIHAAARRTRLDLPLVEIEVRHRVVFGSVPKVVSR